VDWYVTHEGKPLIAVEGLPLRACLYMTPAAARELAVRLIRAALESGQPDAAQVSKERAP
jgi:hypothetical protein